MDTHFTSDPHFGHKSIIEKCNRPFLTVDQMNHVMIERWNSKVKQGDVVYLLGDVFMHMNQSEALSIRRKLNGNIHLILGNHDKGRIAHRMPQAWGSVQESYTLILKEPREKLYLHHFAHRTWPGSHNKSGHLYGHSHGKLSLDYNLRAFDVGVDAWDFYPVGLAEVQAQFNRMQAAREFMAVAA